MLTKSQLNIMLLFHDKTLQKFLLSHMLYSDKLLLLPFHKHCSYNRKNVTQNVVYFNSH